MPIFAPRYIAVLSISFAAQALLPRRYYAQTGQLLLTVYRGRSA